jgi:hypothetical protein
MISSHLAFPFSLRLLAAQKVLFKMENDEFLLVKSLGEKGFEISTEDEEV